MPNSSSSSLDLDTVSMGRFLSCTPCCLKNTKPLRNPNSKPKKQRNQDQRNHQEGGRELQNLEDEMDPKAPILRATIAGGHCPEIKTKIPIERATNEDKGSFSSRFFLINYFFLLNWGSGCGSLSLSELRYDVDPTLLKGHFL